MAEDRFSGFAAQSACEFALSRAQGWAQPQNSCERKQISNGSVKDGHALVSCLKTNTRMAEERFSPSARSASICIITRATGTDLEWAMVFWNPCQNGSSSENEVLCPRMETECFFIYVSSHSSRFGSGVSFNLCPSNCAFSRNKDISV